MVLTAWVWVAAFVLLLCKVKGKLFQFQRIKMAASFFTFSQSRTFIANEC